MADFNHKYPLGELLLFRQERLGYPSKVLGIVYAYDSRYYLVDWNSDVPKYYTGILAEIEVRKLRNNLLEELGHEITEEYY